MTPAKKRVGFIGIVIHDRKEHAPAVNRILTEFGEMVVARTGLPYHERNVSVITLVVDATTDQIGALTGQLGKIKGVSVKSALSKE